MSDVVPVMFLYFHCFSSEATNRSQSHFFLLSIIVHFSIKRQKDKIPSHVTTVEDKVKCTTVGAQFLFQSNS